MNLKVSFTDDHLSCHKHQNTLLSNNIYTSLLSPAWLVLYGFYFLSESTCTHTDRPFSLLKEPWVGQPPGRERRRGKKESCSRRRQALFNIQLIGNLVVCPISAVSGQLPTWWKALLLSSLGRSAATVCVYLCAFVAGECKPAGDFGDIRWDVSPGLDDRTRQGKLLRQG